MVEHNRVECLEEGVTDERKSGTPSVRGLGFRFWNVRFRVWKFGFKVLALKVRVECLLLCDFKFWVQGLVFRVEGLGFRV